MGLGGPDAPQGSIKVRKYRFAYNVSLFPVFFKRNLGKLRLGRGTGKTPAKPENQAGGVLFDTIRHCFDGTSGKCGENRNKIAEIFPRAAARTHLIGGFPAQFLCEWIFTNGFAVVILYLLCMGRAAPLTPPATAGRTLEVEAGQIPAPGFLRPFLDETYQEGEIKI